MLIATAGHVDHGKTSLVKALSGIDTDRLPEEKQRGLTIDLGFAHCDLAEGCRVSFVDVPGHEKFIKNMVAGIGGIDLAMIVIAADDGVMPQTLEHFAILDLLGVKKGLIVITKGDRVEQTRLDEVKKSAEDLGASMRLGVVPIIVASGLTGEGVDQLRQFLINMAQAFDADPDHGYFRMAVDRSFTVPGIGLIATGTVISGTAVVEDRLRVSPQGSFIRLRGIRVSDQPTDSAHTGVRAALNIVGGNVTEQNLKRGNWLTAPELNFTSSRLDVRLSLSASEDKSLNHWSSAHFHHGASDYPCRVALLESKALEPGHEGFAQIVLEQPALAISGDRFILRDQSARRTIGGGVVIDPVGPARGRARPERIKALQIMQSCDDQAVLEALTAEATLGLELDEFLLTRNIRREDLSEFIASQVVAAGRIFSRDRWQRLCALIVKILSETHANSPQDQGLQDEALRRQIDKNLPLAVLHAAMQELLHTQTISRSGSAIHLPAHKAQASRDEVALWAKVEPLLAAGGTIPARELEIVDELDVPHPRLQKFLARATQLGLVYRVSKNRVYLPAAIRQLADLAVGLAQSTENGEFGAAEYRDRSGIGRNLAIEVLEFFDKSGLTKRHGNRRTVIADPDEIFPVD